MKKVSFIVLGLALIFGIYSFADHASSPNSEADKADSKKEIQWLSFEEAVKRSEKEPRKIFMDVYTDWCGWCKRMDANTFTNPIIIDKLNNEWYPVKFDGEYKKTIKFKGKEYKFVESGRRGYNELTHSLLKGRLSYPTTVYLDENSEPIQAVPGYQDPYNLDVILTFFGGDNHHSISWEDFSRTYKSPIEKPVK